MPDISIPGISSKYNTTKLVEDLVAAERIRLTRMEENVSSLEESRSTWRQVSRGFGNLQRAVKSLYGFENPFSEKNAVSSNEQILTATAARNAPLDNYSIIVKQVATADRFLTASMERSFRVEGGRYTFGVGDAKVTLRYRGGTVDDFARRLTEKGGNLIRATTVRDTPDTQVLMIEAVPTGSANRLSFEDDSRNLALRTGMMRLAENRQSRVTPQKMSQSPLTAAGNPIPEGSVEIGEESILVQPSASLRIPLDESMEIEDGMVLEYFYRTVEYSDDDLAPASPPGPLWPEVPDGTYKDLVVRSASNAMELPPAGQWRPPERKDVWDILKAEGSTGSLGLPPISVSPEYRMVRVEAKALPKDFTAMVMTNDNTHRGVEIRDIRLYDPNRQGDLEPAQAVDYAGDALIEFRGIEARRPDNAIDDMVDGLTINLKRASAEPVDLTVEPDTEAAKDGIIRFVFSYNQLLTRILVLTNDDPTVVDELQYIDGDERTEMEEQLGRFRGDITLNQVKNRLQNIASNPYGTRAGADLTLMAQIGVSTNASSSNTGGSLDFSKLRGYLEIDEEKLDEFLERDIDAVKDLFGRDTTGDLVIDSGVAQAMDEYLTPYTRTGGFVSSRISGIEGQIERTKDDISDYEEYLEDYEADLKRQYGNMEAMLNQLENSSKDLDNFSRQQSNGG